VGKQPQRHPPPRLIQQQRLLLPIAILPQPQYQIALQVVIGSGYLMGQSGVGVWYQVAVLVQWPTIKFAIVITLTILLFIGDAFVNYQKNAEQLKMVFIVAIRAIQIAPSL
jgi:hypothetical protein